MAAQLQSRLVRLILHSEAAEAEQSESLAPACSAVVESTAWPPADAEAPVLPSDAEARRSKTGLLARLSAPCRGPPPAS